MPAVLSKFDASDENTDPFVGESLRVRGALNSHVGHWRNRAVGFECPENLQCLAKHILNHNASSS
jgi:hypothetical protein